MLLSFSIVTQNLIPFSLYGSQVIFIKGKINSTILRLNRGRRKFKLDFNKHVFNNYDTRIQLCNTEVTQAL